MANITVKAITETTFEVFVEGEHLSSHQVTLSAEYAKQLTQGLHSHATLIKASFLFLLEREPNTSILRRFDLRVIERYFPEFTKVIQSYLPLSSTP